MSNIALIGPPGSGKSTMAGLTAPRPVHFVDIDRKVKAMPLFRPLIDSGEITYREIGDSVIEGSLAGRIKNLVDDKKSQFPPKGWLNFANYVAKFEEDEQLKKSRSVVIDSYTQLALHMRAHIQFLRDKGKFVWDDWSTWKNIWMETTNALIDYANNSDKHLIVTLHERVSEKPGEDAVQVRVTTGSKGEKNREYTGKLDVRIAGSIEGSFGLDFGTYFTDVYGLRVHVDDDDQLKWICRVHPDAQRDLRCSYAQQFDPQTKKLITEFEPDFRKIWGREWR